jgi:hypothetical protein
MVLLTLPPPLALPGCAQGPEAGGGAVRPVAVSVAAAA